MNAYGELCVPAGTYGACGEYPESQAGMSEVGFDPVLNYVETLGDELKTPKRKPKHRKEGSSTPHPMFVINSEYFNPRASDAPYLAQSRVFRIFSMFSSNSKKDHISNVISW